MTSRKKHTLAFYNIENFFEAESPLLQTSSIKWTTGRYLQKIKKLGLVIPRIGTKETSKHPALIGLAEVENNKVLEDLTQSKLLEPYSYQFVFYRSLDKRGMNVALLYDPSVFSIEASKTYYIELPDSDGEADYTRDILWVCGILEEEKIHVLVNHWPSKREKETDLKRMAAAKKVGEIINKIKQEDPKAKFIVMGDFNDNPNSLSLDYLTKNFQLYNAMEKLRSFSRGSLNHNRQWYLFDQILVSESFVKAKKEEWQIETADIFDENFLKHPKGKHRGIPFRTFLGGNYHGGFSDHFPVYITVSCATEGQV
ncbi:endonuclease [Xanthomarina sp. F1114]|uniref:endonuclease/exonuclease/phosphatase family protein n=1 Tax=Xanthomarina sp. F1114 TaxID=2996019 RepID=UPI00225E41E1|nr:endonuclease/exonuclease/phosphatase family protein [Xanthomarina sp. F1114]MCX7546395.1 endonuclease [Xanthomarina sp. F1114]